MTDTTKYDFKEVAWKNLKGKIIKKVDNDSVNMKFLYLEDGQLLAIESNSHFIGNGNSIPILKLYSLKVK